MEAMLPRRHAFFLRPDLSDRSRTSPRTGSLPAARPQRIGRPATQLRGLLPRCFPLCGCFGQGGKVFPTEGRPVFVPWPVVVLVCLRLLFFALLPFSRTATTGYCCWGLMFPACFLEGTLFWVGEKGNQGKASVDGAQVSMNMMSTKGSTMGFIPHEIVFVGQP